MQTSKAVCYLISSRKRGMDVHKENFTLCCYDMMQDKIFYTQKLEPDYIQILKYLTFVQKALRS